MSMRGGLGGRKPAKARAVGSGSQFSCAIVQGGNLNGRGTCWGTQVDAGVFTFPSTSDTQTYTQMHGAGIGFWTLLPDGTTRTWGKTLFSPPSGTVFKTVADGPSQNRCGILSDSSLLCWGFPNDAATIAPSGTFKAVAMGSGFGCGVKTAGSVVCWARTTWAKRQRASPAPSKATGEVSQ